MRFGVLGVATSFIFAIVLSGCASLIEKKQVSIFEYPIGSQIELPDCSNTYISHDRCVSIHSKNDNGDPIMYGSQRVRTIVIPLRSFEELFYGGAFLVGSLDQDGRLVVINLHDNASKADQVMQVLTEKYGQPSNMTYAPNDPRLASGGFIAQWKNDQVIITYISDMVHNGQSVEGNLKIVDATFQKLAMPEQIYP